MSIESSLLSCPIVAILRGVTPGKVEQVAEVLIDAGIRCIEVPLNSPAPLESIEKLVRMAPEDVTIGAGTVMSVSQVDAVASAGASLILTPNCHPDVIRYSVDKGLFCIPGVVTPTEAFAAIEAGASWLKLFPASHYGVDYWHALKAVLPEQTRVMPVGGIQEGNIIEWLSAGAVGVGIGSNLYSPSHSIEELMRNAHNIVAITKERAADAN